MKTTFAEDCRKEEVKHTNRCMADEWYCIQYLKYHSELQLPFDSLDELNLFDLGELLSRLKHLSKRHPDKFVRAAIEGLITHVKKRLQASPVGMRAVASLW